jgi:hypothetical protein
MLALIVGGEHTSSQYVQLVFFTLLYPSSIPETGIISPHECISTLRG